MLENISISGLIYGYFSAEFGISSLLLATHSHGSPVKIMLPTV